MKVSELKKILENLDDDALVVSSSDSEGNSFSEVHTVEIGVYDAGEFGYGELTDEMKEMGYTEEDIREGDPCVCIWP